MKKLRIAQIAPLWYKIPPKKYGGTEMVVYNLTKGLVKLGHKVTLFAAGDAETSAKLVPTYKKNLREARFCWNESNYPLLNIAKAFESILRAFLNSAYSSAVISISGTLSNTALLSRYFINHNIIFYCKLL